MACRLQRPLAESYWTNPTAEGGANYIAKCMPFYDQRHDASDERLARAIIKTEVAAHFNGPSNEHGRMDFSRDLAKIECPVLMMAGEEDPISQGCCSDVLSARSVSALALRPSLSSAAIPGAARYWVHPSASPREKDERQTQ